MSEMGSERKRACKRLKRGSHEVWESQAVTLVILYSSARGLIPNTETE